MIRQKFRELKNKKQAGLICYYTAGFPNLDKSMENIELLCSSGADIIEIGVPFSDPVADGPVIQQASLKALESGVTLHKILDAVSHLNLSVPIVLMSYLNPILRFSLPAFFKNAKQSGISGVIFPDLPAEESGDIRESAEREEIDTIFLCAPTSSKERIKLNSSLSTGFVYCVTVAGVTGMRSGIPAKARELIEQVKAFTDVPCAAGFGISNSEQIKGFSQIADGVIVGSRILDAVMKSENLKTIVREFKQSTIKNTGGTN